VTGRPCPPGLREQLRGKQPAVIATGCPHCQAAPGQPCRSNARGRRLHQPHAARYEAAGLPTQLATDPPGTQ
jgi:hypothetical protein